MGTHALALGGALLAYRLSARASRHAATPSAGWKIEVLAAYTSRSCAAGRRGVARRRCRRGAARAEPIAYAEAMVVAAIGLVVNLASVRSWARGARHGDARRRSATTLTSVAPSCSSPHHDFSAAYLHVIADVSTLVLAIAALAGGLSAGWRWLDPAVALIGAALDRRALAFRMLKTTARALVDFTSDRGLDRAIRQHHRVRRRCQARRPARVRANDDRSWSAALSVVADRPLAPEVYRAGSTR